MSQDVLERIAGKLSALSKGKRSIATYILENPNEAAFMTAANLGKLVKVSESSVVRFAGDLGFKGYPELQKALQSVLMHHLLDAKEGASSPVRDTPTMAKAVTEETVSLADLQMGAEFLLFCNSLYLSNSDDLTYAAQYFLRQCQDVLIPVSISAGSREETVLRHMCHMNSRDTFVCFLGEGDRLGRFLCDHALRIGVKLVCFTHDSDSVASSTGGVVYTVGNCSSDTCSTEAAMIEGIRSFFTLLKQQGAKELASASQKFKEMQEHYDAYESEEF